MAGQILGDRYRIEQQLGKNMGRWTLLAKDLVTEDNVVLKLLVIDDDLHPNDLKLFIREAETLKALDHPATPRYVGHLEIDLPKGEKAIALIQTYVEGKSLEQCIREGRVFSEQAARRLAHEVLTILVYLHDHQPPIVHRDIKPSNILLVQSSDPEQSATVYLVDFGSVKSLSSQDNTSFTVVGTNGYMPPEQMGGRAVTASDLYSLGITLATALTGLMATQLPTQGLQIDFNVMAGLDPTFVQWLKQMTEPMLDQRFETARDALDALEKLAV